MWSRGGVPLTLLLLGVTGGGLGSSVPGTGLGPRALDAQESAGDLMDPSGAGWSVSAPEQFTALFETSIGDFTIEVHRAWAPLGADRFYNLVRNGYYDDARFHRTVPGFIVQWGRAGDPAVTQVWQSEFFADESPDSAVAASNTRGRVAFAFTDPNTRSTQVYISTVDNSRLDAGGFFPFGEVTDGMDVVDGIYSGYGEDSGGGVRRGDQSRIVAEGNAYLDAEFPELTRLIRATITASTAASGATSTAAPRAMIQVDTAAVTRWVESMMGPAQFPAAAVVIADATGPIYVRTFGESDTDEALTRDSRFYLGSTTKTMTGLAVKQLVAQGLVELDTPVLRYLPDLRFSDPDRGGRVTVRHLLQHTSGLPTIAAFNRRVQRTGEIQNVRFFADPGAEVAYSSLNYQLLGALIEAVSGLPYETYMADRLFGPAGMTRTTAIREEAEAGGLVQGHSYVFGWPVARDEPAYQDRLIPAGYVVSTPADVGRYLALYLDQGVASTVGVDSGLDLGSDIGSDIRSDLGPDMALGWVISQQPGGTVWNHAGMTPGFYSKFAILPDEGLAVAVLTSRNAGPFKDAPAELMNGVLRVVRGAAPNPYFPWERILRLVLAVLVLRSLYATGRLYSRWTTLKSPRRMAHTTGIVARVVFDLALAATLPLWIIRGVAKLPIQEFLTFYPDIGIALILFPALAIPAALLRSLVTSEKLRLEGFATP